MAAHDENAQPSPGQAALPTLASLTRSRPRRPGSFGVERLNSPAAAKLRAADAKGVLSPPPEEILKPQMSTTPARDSKPSSGGSSGRKRVRSLNTLAHAESAPSQPAPASPNPKSRKQQKTVSSSARAAASNLGSPTKPRRKAQQSGSSNAGSSPVRYSPPREQFTPPRIVYLPVEQPASRRRGRSRSTSRARSTTPAKTTRALRSPTPGRRTALIPPGSPGDDPILLVGPEPDWSAHARDLEPQPKEEEVDVAIPPTPLKPARTTPEDSPAQVSIFEAPIAPDDAFARMGNDTAASWDSTDDEQEENEHPASDVVEEFDVPLKQDPPTARTKARMDRFGRPTSPYPLQRGNNSVIAEDDEEEDEDEDGDKKMTLLPDPDSPLSSRHSHSSHSNTATPSRRLSGIRRLSQARLRFSSVEGDDAQPAAQPPSLPALDEDVQMSDEQAPPVSTSPEETPAQRGPGRVPLSESSSGESFTKHGDVSTASADRPTTPRGRRTLREMSFDFDCVPARSTQDSMARSTQDSMVAVDASDDEDGESEIETGPGVIQISSSDPIAAARAAAILKKHHQYVQEGIRRRQSRSHSRSRASSAGRGSPAFSVVSNNDLLRLTEAEIELESALGSPSKHPAQAPRTWTKDDWKLLDASFSAVREEQGLDVDEVEPKMVVDRFFAVLAEEGRGVSFEELAGEWTWDKILRRVIALRAKQRGNPAPSVAATPRSSRAPSETPSMRVPDFTPQVVRGMYPRLGALRRPDFDAARGTPPPPTRTPAHGTFEFPRKVSANVKDVPPQLVGLAPRYNTPARPQAAVHPPPGVFVPPSTPQRPQAAAPEPPPSTAKRMMGYLSSWLGVAKPQPQPKLPQPSRAGLPPPPPYLPRAVATPPRRPGERPPAPSVPLHAPPPAIREPAPEAVHPRDAVALQHAQPVRRERARVVPHKETVELQHAEPVQHTPARAPNPREMVELHHVSPPPSARKIAGPTVGAMRNRTASGGSVKDMVKNFEAVAQEKERRRNADLEEAKAKMRRTKSLQGLSGLAQGSCAGSGMTRTASVSGIPRPAWR